MEFKKSDPRVAGIVQKCYPNYRGRRKVQVKAQEKYRATNYWDGGSRDYVEYLHLPSGRLLTTDQVDFEQQKAGNPFNLDIGYVTLTPEIAAVENVIFRGKDLGVRIYLHPDTYAEWER